MPRARTPALPGIGEMFGEAVDAVIRRPMPAALPLLLDAGAFLAILLVLSILGQPTLEAPWFSRASFSFGISTALPSLADTLDVAGATRAAPSPTGLLFVTVAAVALLPVVAFVEAGFVAVLHAAYVEKREGPVLAAFLPAARSRFLPILAYRAVLTASFLAALWLSSMGGVFRNSAAGALSLRFLLVFAPYAIVIDGDGFVEGVKRSVLAVGDHLATCLVLLLFHLLVSGGVAALVAPFVRETGAVAVLVGMIAYAPLGTALATFVLLVWRSFRPPETLPEPAPAPAASPA